MNLYIKPFKTYVRNYLNHIWLGPAVHVHITEKFVELKTFDLDLKHTGTKFLYILEGKSY